ncbi:MAG TPA: phytanoyl-CoA dioxygenase family protein [Candidatus Aquilonibacter sp.]|nr:phytanoyl-CoA dioxygenase family protein [Candidatus Aquilonibacter sp.]
MGSLSSLTVRLDISGLQGQVERDGFAVVPSCMSEEIVGRLGSHFAHASHGIRNLLAEPIVRELAASIAVRALAEAVLGKNCFAIKGIFFNKTPEANWKVVWHQDLTIMVGERREVPAFGPWTVKAGIVHVQPPAEVLGRVLAIRLHLDESGPDNGPLRVIPGSHKQGRLSAEKVVEWQKAKSMVCTVPRGGALLMRPLLLHASSACVVPNPRRVIHLEFAAESLPGGLEWHDRV